MLLSPDSSRVTHRGRFEKCQPPSGVDFKTTRNPSSFHTFFRTLLQSTSNARSVVHPWLVGLGHFSLNITLIPLYGDRCASERFSSDDTAQSLCAGKPDGTHGLHNQAQQRDVQYHHLNHGRQHQPHCFLQHLVSVVHPCRF